MANNHDNHDHGHSHAPPSNNLAFAVGVSLNVAFVVVEVIYGIAAQSLALLADAGHNLSDVKFLQEVGRELHEQFEIAHVTVQIEHGDVDVTCEQEPAHVV